MAKYKLTKYDKDWLRKEALKLPPDFSTTINKTSISGREAALSGLKKTSNTGQAIIPDERYTIKTPNVIPVNHKRRLIQAYEQGGWVQVNRYLDKYRVPGEKLFHEPEKAPQPEARPSIMQRIRNKFLK